MLTLNHILLVYLSIYYVNHIVLNRLMRMPCTDTQVRSTVGVSVSMRVLVGNCPVCPPLNPSQLRQRMHLLFDACQMLPPI